MAASRRSGMRIGGLNQSTMRNTPNPTPVGATRQTTSSHSPASDDASSTDQTASMDPPTSTDQTASVDLSGTPDEAGTGCAPIRVAEGHRSEAPFLARVRSKTVDLPPTLSVVALFDGLVRATGASAGMLLETADAPTEGPARSLLFPAPVVRLRLRGTEVRLERTDPDRALPLAAMERRTELHEARSGEAARDSERLLQPSCLDSIRGLLTSVEDDAESDGSETALPVTVAGALGYEIVDRFEALPQRALDPLDEDDASVGLVLDGVVIDHRASRLTYVVRALSGEGVDSALETELASLRLRRFELAVREAIGIAEPGARSDDRGGACGSASPGPRLDPSDRVSTDLPESRYLAGVSAFQQKIREGEIFQGVLSRSQSIRSDVASLDVYAALRSLEPSPYMFHYDLGDGSLLGASPETSVRVRGGKVEIRPIAGTAPRGRMVDGLLDRDQDTRFAVGLLLDAKEQAEHAMLVDLARNDVARISVPGTREVEAPLSIERYRHVQHIVTRVTGRLGPGLDALDAYRACANPGTLTGAPKLRAMELIRETEPTARGYYGGAVFHLSADGDFDSCIVIRSLRQREGTYTARSGAGIVKDSVPAREYEETKAKARAPLAAILAAERLGHTPTSSDTKVAARGEGHSGRKHSHHRLPGEPGIDGGDR